ncbi:uncharacterized protein A4U43_C08F12970 [Asparagus officinalis]|nr:uncharacterized protein A4U43_C08F12970 [Asparagus officinalis]
MVDPGSMPDTRGFGGLTTRDLLLHWRNYDVAMSVGGERVENRGDNLGTEIKTANQISGVGDCGIEQISVSLSISGERVENRGDNLGTEITTANQISGVGDCGIEQISTEICDNGSDRLVDSSSGQDLQWGLRSTT